MSGKIHSYVINKYQSGDIVSFPDNTEITIPEKMNIVECQSPCGYGENYLDIYFNGLHISCSYSISPADLLNKSYDEIRKEYWKQVIK